MRYVEGSGVVDLRLRVEFRVRGRADEDDHGPVCRIEDRTVRTIFLDQTRLSEDAQRVLTAPTEVWREIRKAMEADQNIEWE